MEQSRAKCLVVVSTTRGLELANTKKKKKKLQFRHFSPTFCPKASEAEKWEVRKNKFMVNINEKKYDEEQTTVRTENTVRISNSYQFYIRK